ncbi:MAG: PIN domain-containing protein [Euryarchaeota archaeon]|nr:PIN domain-containing protein [Euryarchaeota archaeon]
MRIADTSLLYALFSENDVHHKEAMEKVKKPETIFIPSEIWSETISLIHYRQGFDMAVKAGKALIDLPHVELLSSRMDIVRSSWVTYQKTNGDLSVPDCFVLVWCNDKGAAPLTFDKDIKRHFEKNSN